MRDTYARNDNLNRRPAFLHQLDSPNTALVRWPPDGAQVRLEVLVGQVLETVEAPRRCPGVGLDEEVGSARRDGLVHGQPGCWRPAARRSRPSDPPTLP